MIFHELEIKGAFVLEQETIADERGHFARTFCAREFEARGMNPRVAQCSVSFNKRRGTLRGMHFQAAPHQEAKLVSCEQGAIYDVLLDLRDGSPTFRRWVAVELRAGAGRSVFIPEGVAHGFQTLADDTLVAYQISAFYHPESSRGVRWDDPAFGIAWPPEASRVISARDASYPLVGGG